MAKKTPKPSVNKPIVRATPNGTAPKSRTVNPISSPSETLKRQAPVAPPEPLDPRPIQPLWGTLVAAVAFALYINTFQNGLALDDIAAITQNLFVQKGIEGIPDLLRTEFWHFSNISLGYYRPLALISFALEKEYFNADPHISHIINAVIYALTGFSLIILLQKWLPGRTVFTTLIALLFVAHPIHTEVVANIKSRDEMLSFLFMTFVLLTYWKYLETKQIGWVIFSAFWMYLTYLSKESSLVGLGLIVIMQYTFARKNFWISLLNIWPYILVTALFFWQKKLMIGTLSGNPPVDWANYPYAIEQTKFLTTFKFFAHYLQLLLVPFNLSYDYSYNVIPSGRWNDGVTWFGLLSFAGLVWLAWKGFWKRSIWGFGLAWMFITMAPGLGFVFSRGGILAERFLYSPVLGFVLAALAALDLLLEKRMNFAEETPVLKRYGVMIGLCIAVTALFSFRTISRNEDWKDNFTLFNSGLKYADNSCQVHRHVANEWINKCQSEKDPKLKRKYFDLAIGHLRRSTEIYPGFGEAYFSMAYSYQRLIPNIDSAIYFYKQTIRASSAYAPAYNNLGVIYQDRRRYHLASHYFFMSTRVNPAYQDGMNNYLALKNQLKLDVQILPDSLQYEGVNQIMANSPTPIPTVQLPKF
ncbi:tetratricopeptide repeat protein [Tellurirhabdus bombi]|uniref:tetratricopeptide repeat protein n=1 Tax=Tellurirhabdus bombi TaxID=2907205 RepID=UPI001F3FAEB8|nr:tetratricopeptide repeat protein [Tellurirhabdus bombi]